MRITFLLTQSLESPSGNGRYWPLAKELVKLGHEVTILALHHDLASLRVRHYRREGVRVWYVAQMHVRKVGSQKLYFSPIILLYVVVRATLALLWGAIVVQTDAYHVCKPHPMNGIAGVVSSWLKRKPLYIDCDDYEAGSNVFRGDWQRRVVDLFEQRLPCLAQGITVNTQFMLERLTAAGYPPERLVYVPNGVDLGRFAEGSISRPGLLGNACESITLVERPVVLYVGSLSLKSHAVDLLLEAFPHVLQVNSRTVLVLVGGGEHLEDLRRYAESLGIKESVCFVGRVAPERVADYYQLANVTVDPVRNDPASMGRSPLKLFESWASGVPCVTSDVGDRKCLLGSPAAGVLTLPGDSEALADALVQLINDPNACQEISRMGKIRVQAFCWRHLALTFVEVYSV